MPTNRREKGNTRAFLKAREKEYRAFRSLIKKESLTSPIAAENGTVLTESVLNSLRAMKNVRTLPLKDGIPHLYRLVQTLLIEQGFSEKAMKETLMKNGREYEDEELSLLAPFLISASAELYLQTGESAHLQTILTVSRLDFSEVFFSFSKIEKIFLSESAGFYANGSVATKYLYHRRLSAYARRKRADPSQTARAVVAKANEKNTHIGEVLPKICTGGRRYFVFLCLMTAALLSVI